MSLILQYHSDQRDIMILIEVSYCFVVGIWGFYGFGKVGFQKKRIEFRSYTYVNHISTLAHLTRTV